MPGAHAFATCIRGIRRDSRHRGVVAASAALVLLLAGCASIPAHGPVKVGTVPNTGVQNGVVEFRPPGPVAGSTEADIVDGFVNAATGQQGDYAVAREFLAPTFAKVWKPAARVLVSDGGIKATQQSGKSVVTLAVPTVASVDSTGTYSSTATGSQKPSVASLRFELTKVSGEWRIAKTADGIVLAQSNFQRLFMAAPLAFFDPTYSYAVPDLRWFPARSVTATSVVRALLRGAAPPLASPVTASAFPAGTTLRRVSGEANLATVDLGMHVSPTIVELRRMKAQLTASLATLAANPRIQIAVNGVVRPVADLALADPPAPDPRPLVLKGGVFGFLGGGALRPAPVLGREIAALHPNAVTTSAALGIAAVRTAAAVVVLSKSGPKAGTVVDKGAGLVAPTLDPRGWTWLVPAVDPSGITAFDTHGDSSVVTAGFPPGSTIVSIEVSRDGTRLLALLTTPDGPLATVAGIVRDASGQPVAITTARFSVAVGDPGSTAIDATWVDNRSVATLVHGQAGDDVTVQQLGGASTAVRPLPNATAIVGGATLSDLTALLPHGDLATLQDGVWVPGTNVGLLATQR